MSEHIPSCITVDDINNVLKILEEPIPIEQCCTCDRETHVCFLADGMQCQECFMKGIPMFGKINEIDH